MIKKAIIPFISLLFFSYLSAQGFQFAQTIIVDNDLGNVVPGGLTFGFSPDATDAYDDGTDQLAPPAPPPPAFDAALTFPAVELDTYYTNIVNGDSLDLIEHVWEIQLQYGENSTINLTQDNSGWSDLGTFVFQDAFGGMFIDVDMVDLEPATMDSDYGSIDISDPTNPVLMLTNPVITTLNLFVTPNGTSGSFLSTIENYGITPADFSLYGNYPNPFNPITSLRYGLPERAQVTLTVFDLMGRQITQLVNTTQDVGF